MTRLISLMYVERARGFGCRPVACRLLVAAEEQRACYTVLSMCCVKRSAGAVGGRRSRAAILNRTR